MARKKIVALSSIALVSVWATPLAAQFRVGGDAVLANRYVWRGVTRSLGWVLQPGLHLGTGTPLGEFSGGVWANLELFDPDSTDLSDLGPEDGALSEVNYWLQYANQFGPVNLAAGWIAYSYPAEAGKGLIRLEPTSEVFIDAALTQWRAVPRVSGWLDLSAVSGAYFETSLMLPVLANPLASPFAALTLGITGGWSVGQGFDSSAPQGRANFVDDGLTYIDLSTSAGVGLPVGFSTRIGFEVHYQFGVDDAVRVRSRSPTDLDRLTKAWVAFTLSADLRK